MTKLEQVIADIESVNKNCRAWIYDENGNIKEDVICGNVLYLLEELKAYEIETTNNAIKKIVELSCNNGKRWNTYNWNANIDHNLDVAELEINGYTYMCIMAHRFGDIRANYTDRFMVRFDDEYTWFELESRMQYKSIADGRYTVDIDIMNECYSVWDNEKQNDVGEFYKIEVKDLLEEIANTTK